VVATYPRSIKWGGRIPHSGWNFMSRGWPAWPTRLPDGRVLAVRSADPPPDSALEKLAGLAGRYLKMPVKPRLDARLIDALTGRELAAIRCDNTSLQFAPDGLTLVAPRAADLPAVLPPHHLDTADEFWDVPPRQPLSWLAAGMCGWTLFVATAMLLRRKSHEHARSQRPRSHPAAGH
jgi:hypothetical protein